MCARLGRYGGGRGLSTRPYFLSCRDGVLWINFYLNFLSSFIAPFRTNIKNFNKYLKLKKWDFWRIKIDQRKKMCLQPALFARWLGRIIFFYFFCSHLLSYSEHLIRSGSASQLRQLGSISIDSSGSMGFSPIPDN